MENEIAAARHSLLFDGIREDEIRSMLKCLSARTRKYRKGETILTFGDEVSSIGLLVSGAANVTRDDYWGNSNIVTAVLPGESFADAYACSDSHPLTVSVTAVRDSTVMFLEVRRILNVCSSACSFHSRFIHNLVHLLASRSLEMNEKISYLTQRSMRKKILAYLSAQALKNDSDEFDIPFDRQMLADYLSVDRSALSAELSKMQSEGTIEYRKNHFRLLREE